MKHHLDRPPTPGTTPATTVAAGVPPAVEGGILPPGPRPGFLPDVQNRSNIPSRRAVLPPGRTPGSTAGKMPAVTILRTASGRLSMSSRSAARLKLLCFNFSLSVPLCGISFSVFCLLLFCSTAWANPTGGTIAQGTASFTTAGSKLTINTSANTFINWSSFNIGAGETTTFVQPSATSVVWNQINGGTPSQILGNLNANGYVILQNQSGFVVGGQASINTHGLLMTTAPIPAPNLSSGGPWSFNAPPPTAKIINYGQINIAGGGSAFLIASDMQNNGTIAAPGGKIGLYAGQQVLVSSSPDGRGLSAKATLPQGSVDNEGRLIADAGSIAALAQTVNQNGLVQADSVRNVNGVIELVAGDSVALGANSQISAQGGAQGVSPGGTVTIKSGNMFSDQPGSLINVSGGAQGGNGGQVEISAAQPDAIQSTINGRAAAGFTAGMLTLDPTDITIDAPYAASLNSLISGGLSQITVQADNDIDVTALWTLTGTTPGIVSLTAGNNITLDPGAGIVTGNYWGVNLTAGNTIQLNQNSQIQANGGNITLKAANVNQNGLLKAGSVGTANGVVEIDASAAINLGSASDIEVAGDGSAGSPGGFVVLQAGATFNDTAGSAINVAGSNGGVDGVVEIFGNNLTDATSINSQIDGFSALQFGSQDILLVNPYDITLSSNPTDTSTTSPNLSVSDLANYSQIDIHALDNIELQTEWFINDSVTPASLSLQAGNSITLDDGAGIAAGREWNVNLTAGTSFVPTATQTAPASGTDGVYLNSSTDNDNSTAAFIQTQNGDINVWAANEVLLASSGRDLVGNTGIRTLHGGNISVTTQYGDVNTGANPNGYIYINKAPYTTVSTGLGGISTAAGGNVTISAGGNVFSFLPSGSTSVAADDGGTGAFGSQPGNVTITAGGSVYGHYVLADGVGSITAGQDVGAANGNPFALSLMDGSWSVNAPNGNIYLQEVRNPNGDFNDVAGTKRASNPGAFLFNYAADASVDLTADGVYLIGGQNVPRPYGDVPVLYPPILNITAGAGGVTLENNVTLFPSPDQSLTITTTAGGSLTATAPVTADAAPIELLMSDSSSTHWVAGNAILFSDLDNSSGTPELLNNPNPVIVKISGDMENLNLITSKATQITVGGDMVNCGFSGQNLHPGDATTFNVAGQIYNQSAYAFVTLPQGLSGLPAADLPSWLAGSWDNIFTLALVPAAIANLPVPANLTPSQWANYAIQNATLFGLSYVQSTGQYVGNNPGFVFNPATGQLGFGGPMAQSTLSALSQPVTVLVFGANGLPLTYTANGKTYFQTTQITWVAPAEIQTLFTDSQADPSPSTSGLGYRVGGPGQFDVAAGSISLGNTYGILTCGVSDPDGGFDRYGNLASITPSGATLNVTVTGELDMLTSTIAAVGGGDVNVTSTGGSMDLGTEIQYNISRPLGFGVFSSGGGNVNVTALGDINIDGSRIATYNGGDMLVKSLQGSVDVGSGISSLNNVSVSFVNPATGLAGTYNEAVYGSGLVALTLAPAPSGAPFPPNSASAPGNITVETPRGNITATLGGITQQALDGSIAGGPVVTLVAGTPGTPGYTGNIDLGESGVIGGEVNITANGSINAGLVLSRQNSTIVAAHNFTGTVLAGGSANVAGGGTVSGTIIGVGGAEVSGGSVTAEVLSQNASVNGGAAQTTLGTQANASAASQSAANQSNAQAQQQVASNTQADDDQKRNNKPKPALVRRVKRVTVLFPGET